MPRISAILQTHNDALRVGRTLETLHPCDEILIIDRDSTDRTVRIARDWGCRICDSNRSVADVAATAKHDWLLLLNPTESITEGLEATLFEWRIRAMEEVQTIPACSISVRHEIASGWSDGRPETRLIPKTWNRWADLMPAPDPQALLLEGDLLRFLTP
jgi:glycosyltransferase involved in cell wall biosynthesis